jgi:hypothetical protein
MEWFGLQTALVLGYLFYGLTIGIHVLVIAKIVTYSLVNGGRSKSYDVQKRLSFISTAIAVIGILFLAVNHLVPTLHETRLYGIIAFVLAAYWGLGYVLQLLGTKLEKWVISWVLILGIASHLILGLLAFV